MATHDIIVIGASAGGVETLMRLAEGLPANLPAAVFVVLHVPASGTSFLPEILGRAGPLPALHPRNGQTITPGRIYVAPPDYHLLVGRRTVTLSRGPRENRSRPAIDPLFRTAAQSFGPRVVGVVLSGTLDDGTAGLVAIKRRGGIAVVQDPADAVFPGMPRSAAEHVAVDYLLPVAEIASTLMDLAWEPVEVDQEGAGPVDGDDLELDNRFAEFDLDAIQRERPEGTPATFGCPECGGTLWELRDGDLTRFRCRVGHAFSMESLLAEQSEALEDALWSALSGLEERASLVDRLMRRSRDAGQTMAAARFETQAEIARQRAAVIRNVLLRGDGPAEATAAEERAVEATTAAAEG